MASFAARRPPRAAWGVEECARFAALKEFELLRLLSTDRKALATARRLGLFASHSQPHPPAAAVGGAAATAPSAAADQSSAAPKVPNARQKRSAARSARHHAEMRAAQPPHPQSPTPAAPAEKVLAETAIFAADSSAELDKDTEKVAPATGLIALVRAAASKRSRPSSASSASTRSSRSDSRMSGHTGFPPMQRGVGREHGRAVRTVTPEEFFSLGVT